MDSAQQRRMSVAAAAAAAVLAVAVAGGAPAAGAAPGGVPAAGVAPAMAGWPGAAPARVRHPIPGRYIVTVAPGHDPAAALSAVGGHATVTYRTAVHGFAAALGAGQAAALGRQSDVLAVEPDQVVSTDGTQTMDPDDTGCCRRATSS